LEIPCQQGKNREFSPFGLARPPIDTKYGSRSNELRGNSLRIGAGNFLRRNRELNQAIREFSTWIRESRFWVVPLAFAIDGLAGDEPTAQATPVKVFTELPGGISVGATNEWDPSCDPSSRPQIDSSR
jgi:beta-glucosidase-like glycosyl hydrolase